MMAFRMLADNATLCERRDGDSNLLDLGIERGLGSV
jgi:hypothetical protein